MCVVYSRYVKCVFVNLSRVILCLNRYIQIPKQVFYIWALLCLVCKMSFMYVFPCVYCTWNNEEFSIHYTKSVRVLNRSWKPLIAKWFNRHQTCSHKQTISSWLHLFVYCLHTGCCQHQIEFKIGFWSEVAQIYWNEIAQPILPFGSYLCETQPSLPLLKFPMLK